MRALRQTIPMLRAMLPFIASTAAMLSGYDIMKRTGMSKQTSYNAMHRLARVGWLSPKIERSNLRMGYPPRMLYTPTPEGISKAQATLALLKAST